MYRNDEEKLVDIVLGEAVLALLKGDAAINNAALIRQLQAMSAVEKNATRQRACRQAITDVRNNIKSGSNRYTHEIRDTDNVTHLFTSEGPPNGTKKH
ncbi:hypothetical protein ACMGGR_16155 [Erwinia sp. BNK-24-b]|uniref:hypothetical protein n=1 Tax=Erwinia TaxID=551 RepID=UPI001FED487A|nr:hypothetical protein [Erwinia phyllosphaerae]MBV4366015.1 hypothetical protein [Erwinia phyllosphaerae]